MTLVCPKCYLEHEDTVLTCDCGYDLQRRNPRSTSSAVDYIFDAEYKQRADIQRLNADLAGVSQSASQSYRKQSDEIKALKNRIDSLEARTRNANMQARKLAELETEVQRLSELCNSLVAMLKANQLWDETLAPPPQADPEDE
jgi:TolA-binding protein